MSDPRQQDHLHAGEDHLHATPDNYAGEDMVIEPAVELVTVVKTPPAVEVIPPGSVEAVHAAFIRDPSRFAAVRPFAALDVDAEALELHFPDLGGVAW